MIERRSKLFGPLNRGVLLLLVACAGLLAACEGGDSSDRGSTTAPPASPASAWMGMVLEEPLRKPDFTLTDTSGQPYNFLKETEGYLTYLYFGYTYCPDICPSHMADIASVLKGQPGLRDRVKVVFVTVDPDRDTLDRLRMWLDLFDESFVGLTGSAAEIEAATKAALGELWFPVEKSTPDAKGNYLVSHAAFVQLYTEDNLCHIVYPFGVPRAGYEHDLLKLVKEGWNES